MSGKNKKKKKQEKTRKKYPPASMSVDERAKSAMALQPPDQNPFKMENEKKIDMFRPAWRTDRKTLREKNKLANRQHRPKKPKNRINF